MDIQGNIFSVSLQIANSNFHDICTRYILNACTHDICSEHVHAAIGPPPRLLTWDLYSILIIVSLEQTNERDKILRPNYIVEVCWILYKVL